MGSFISGKSTCWLCCVYITNTLIISLLSWICSYIPASLLVLSYSFAITLFALRLYSACVLYIALYCLHTVKLHMVSLIAATVKVKGNR